MTPTTGRALALLILATCLWGVSSAAIAAITAPSLGSAAPVAAGGALAVLAVCVVRGDRPWRSFAAGRRLYLALGALETANLVTYIAALRLGPLPVVVALHLTAPVLLILTGVVTGRRAPGAAVVLEVALVGAAIALVATGRSGAGAPTAVLAGCVLAVVSAACVAALVTLVARHSKGRAPLASAGLQLLVAAGCCLPLLITGAPGAVEAAQLVVVGACALGPGFACYWWALRTLDATTAGIVGLNEAVAASVVGAALTGTRLTPATITAGALVLMAVAVQLWSEPEPGAPPGRKRHTPAGPCRRRWSRRRC